MKVFWEKLKVKWNIESDKRMAWIFVIFAITGSSITQVRKPITEWIFDKSTYGELHWYEFILTFILIYFVYQLFLFAIGSLLGEYRFVKWFLIKMNKQIFPFFKKK